MLSIRILAAVLKNDPVSCVALSFEGSFVVLPLFTLVRSSVCDCTASGGVLRGGVGGRFLSCTLFSTSVYLRWGGSFSLRHSRLDVTA